MYNNYQDLDAYIDNNKRFYITPNGDHYPSVTSILGATSDKSWLGAWKNRIGEEEANRITVEAAERGTAVHDYLERLYDPNADISIISREVRKEKKSIYDLVNKVYKATRSNKMVVNAAEIALYHDELRYAGRVDVVGTWNGMPVILDYKTSLKIKRVEWIRDYKLQCTSYAMAHNRMFGTDIKYFVIVIGVDQAEKAQIFTGSVAQFESEWVYRVNKYHKENN